ncbi:MAG: flippase-like domain-containing protein [Actinobacteria bacterium]|nr:flippase-like domain-containing protein [Actinomycetota bacterium]
MKADAQQEGQWSVVDIKSKKFKRGFIVAISLSVLTILGIILFTMNGSTWKAVSKINPLCFLAALGILLIKWAAQILRTDILIKASGARLKITQTAKVVMSGCFTGAVTPFHAGGVPVEIYFMHTYGISVAQSTAVITAGSILCILMFVLSMPPIFILAASKFNVSMGFQTILVVAGIIALFMLLLVLCTMKDAHKLATRMLSITPQWLKNKKWFARAVDRLFNMIADFSVNLRRIIKYGKKHLAAVGVLTCIIWGSALFIPAFILWGLGHPELFWKATIAQLMVSSLLPFMPVPGESGVAELTFSGIYAAFIPMNLVGVVALFWRFFTFYIVMFVSGIVFLFALRDSKKQRREFLERKIPDMATVMERLPEIAGPPVPEVIRVSEIP